MEERILNELRELALIYKRRKCRNPKSGCANRYTKEQKLAVVEAYVKDHVPIYELSQEFGVSDVSIWRYWCPIKLFLDNKNLGLVPFAGISPFWLFLFYHKLL